MSMELDTAHLAVAEWLDGEHAYQFDKSKLTFGDDFGSDDENLQRLDFIMGQEMPNKWTRQRLFREQGADLQASQQVMKVCAAARAVIIYSGILDGKSFEEGDATTREMIEDADFEDSAMREFGQHLRSDFVSAAGTNRYTVENRRDQAWPVFNRTIGLAVANVCEIIEITGVATLPKPGETSGSIVPWLPKQVGL